jgi:tRNA dimethylallyltransferase
VRKAAVLIAGPTASGKSAIAVLVARALGGTVVNADSMQVYGDLHVLTARPGPEDEAAVPHELFGHVDGATNYSVARYVADAALLLDRLSQTNIVPVLVGGTGLYFKALTEGLSDIPPVPDSVRERLRSEFAGAQPSVIHAALRRLDPLMADRLRPSDPVRTLRALEVFAATGRSLSTFQGSRRPGPLAGYRLVRVFLAPDRAVLRERIDRRFAGWSRAAAWPRSRRLPVAPSTPPSRSCGRTACQGCSRNDAAR